MALKSQEAHFSSTPLAAKRNDRLPFGQCAPRGNLNQGISAQKCFCFSFFFVDILKEKVKGWTQCTHFDFSISLRQTCSKPVMSPGFPFAFSQLQEQKL